MRKLLLVFLIVLPCVVLAQNKKGKKTPKVIEWSDEEGTFRIYPNHVTAIGAGGEDAESQTTKSTKASEKSSQQDYDPQHPITNDCMCKGKKLQGRVKVVKYNESHDFNVKLKKYGLGDLKVERVTYPSHRCGEWYFVESGQDFTIMFVETGEDFSINYVNASAGLR